MTGVYVRDLPVETFAAMAVAAVEEDLGRELDEHERSVLGEIAPLVQERVKLTTSSCRS